MVNSVSNPLNIRKPYLLLMVISFFIKPMNAQNFIGGKNFGGTSEDFGEAISQTNDGGLFLGGYSYSEDSDVNDNEGSSDFWTLKLNQRGRIEWKNNYGGFDKEILFDIDQAANDEYILIGESNSDGRDVNENKGKGDVWVVKLTPRGRIHWEESFGGSEEDYARSVEETNDKGFVIGASTNSSNKDISNNNGKYDIWVIKLNRLGGLEWEKTYGGSSYDYIRDIQQTQDGGYIFVGHSFSSDGNVSGNYGNADVWVVKLNASGGIEWQDHYGGNGKDIGNSVKPTNDGGFIIAGKSGSSGQDVAQNNGQVDGWVFKLDNSGKLQWEENYGGSNDDKFHSIQETKEDGLIVSGLTESNDQDVGQNYGSQDVWVVKLGKSGTLKWEKNYGGQKKDWSKGIKQLNNGNYVGIGSSNSDASLYDVSRNNGKEDYWMFRIKSKEFSNAKNAVAKSKQKIFPNPVNKKANLKVNFEENQRKIVAELISPKGKTLQKRKVINGQSKTFRFDLKPYSPGLYFLRIKTDQGVITKKLEKVE